MPKYPVEILWCANRSGFAARRNGWSFPTAVAKQIQHDCEGMTIIHFFGGLSQFGTRMDIDEKTRPDVLGDAWLPPFARSSFDVVILDPPYIRLNQQEKNQLLANASWVARKRVVWFHTLWMAAGTRLTAERAFLIRVGDTCQVRCMQYFVPRDDRKREPPRWIQRGPGMKYNRWLIQPHGLPFGVSTEAVEQRAS